MGTVPAFRELIAATTRIAAHLETRDACTPDDPAFLDWKAGRPVPAPAGAAWYDLVREHTARGVEFRRARIVSEPLADYIRFECESTAFNVAAGERVRWLSRHTAPGLLVPLADFWLFDDRLVRFGFFAGDGTFLRHDLCDDPGGSGRAPWPSSRSGAGRFLMTSTGPPDIPSCPFHLPPMFSVPASS